MTITIDRFKRITVGLIGSIVGDALGVPVEFNSRVRLSADPVKGMRGHGTHQQPPGTWSDDSSMMLCLVESLLERGYNPEDIGQRFVQWSEHGYWTPYGVVFDIGGTTHKSIARLMEGFPAINAGLDDAYSNGNGSLMRILPAALYFADEKQDTLLKTVSEISCITHAHPISQIACCIYSLFAVHLLKGENPFEAYQKTCEESRQIFNTTAREQAQRYFARVLDGNLAAIPEQEIQSGGYVVHTLEASIWCLLQHHTFQETVLAAVNLGDDTDTTAAVAGGLAGIIYGRDAIPDEWVQSLARVEEIEDLLQRFAFKVINEKG